MCSITYEYDGKIYSTNNMICGLGVIFLPPTPIMLVAGVYGGMVVLDDYIIGTVIIEGEGKFRLDIDHELEQKLNDRVALICRTAGIESDRRSEYALWYFLVNREGMEFLYRHRD